MRTHGFDQIHFKLKEALSTLEELLTNPMPSQKRMRTADVMTWQGLHIYPHACTQRTCHRRARLPHLILCIIIAMTFQLSSQILPRILRRTFSVGTLSRMPIKVCTFTVLKSVLKLYAVVIAFERGQRVDLHGFILF